jgi:hypothetical protein
VISGFSRGGARCQRAVNCLIPARFHRDAMEASLRARMLDFEYIGWDSVTHGMREDIRSRRVAVQS